MATYRVFADFWPYYLKQHSHPATRMMHIAGTAIAYAGVLGTVYRVTASAIEGHFDVFDFDCAVSGIGIAYALAWFSHFTIERNAPATFEYPLWSLRADVKMLDLAMSARLDDEIRRVAG